MTATASVREAAGDDPWKAVSSQPGVLSGARDLQAAGLAHNFYYL